MEEFTVRNDEARKFIREVKFCSIMLFACVIIKAPVHSNHMVSTTWFLRVEKLKKLKKLKCGVEKLKKLKKLKCKFTPTT